MSKKNDNARITLGNKAQELASEIAGDNEAVNATHLDVAIGGLLQKVETLSNAKNEPGKAEVSPALRKLFQKETDQLHHELSVKMDEQFIQVVNLLNGVRYMLNIFGEEQSGHDVEELILTTNDWLDRTIKPIETSRQEKAAANTKTDRPENEHENIPDQTAAMSQVQQPVQDLTQQAMEFDQERSNNDGREV